MLSAPAFEPADRGELRQHLLQCASARGRLHRLRCTLEAFDAFLSPRFVTMLGTMTVLMFASLAWLP